MICFYSKLLNVIIGVLNRQPDDSTHGHPSGNTELRDTLQKVELSILDTGNPLPDIIIVGDFNLPHTNWADCSPLRGGSRKEKDML